MEGIPIVISETVQIAEETQTILRQTALMSFSAFFIHLLISFIHSYGIHKVEIDVAAVCSTARGGVFARPRDYVFSYPTTVFSILRCQYDGQLAVDPIYGVEVSMQFCCVSGLFMGAKSFLR